MDLDVRSDVHEPQSQPEGTWSRYNGSKNQHQAKMGGDVSNREWESESERKALTFGSDG